MANNGTDFQSIYREHAYEVYRDAFEELRDAEQTRECVYQVFSRIRAEGLTDPAEIRAKIPEYRAAYVAQIKTARLDVDQVWYRIRNDELTERADHAESMPSFRDRLRDEARRTREAAARQAELTGEAPEAAPDEVPAAAPDAAPDAAPAAEEPAYETTAIHADPGIELTAGEPAEDLPEEPEAPVPEEYAEDLPEEPEVPLPEEYAEDLPEEPEALMPEDPGIGEETEELISEAPEAEASAVETPVHAAVPAPVTEEEDLPKKGSKLYWIIFVIVLVIFLWVLADILMYKGILPGVDLGYSWFNEHIFALFPYV